MMMKPTNGLVNLSVPKSKQAALRQQIDLRYTWTQALREATASAGQAPQEEVW